MNKKTYSTEEFEAMVKGLEDEIFSLMAKAESEAAESKEDQKEEKDEEKEEGKSEEKQEAAESKEEPKAEEKKEDDEDSHGYDDEDMEEMHKMYDSMSKGELKAHKGAVEKTWMAKCGDMTQMTKSEATPAAEVKVSESASDLLKSENESLKKQNEELKKNIENLVSALNTYVTKKAAPQRKAITNIEFVKKSEETPEAKPLTKSEIDNILKKKVQDPSISSKDRQAINEFYLTNASVEKVQHLLKQ